MNVVPQSRKFKTALIVGRFQPFHKGHLSLLRSALELADEVVIALGSSNVENEKNPLSFEKRVAMVQQVIQHEQLADRVKKIVPSPDHPDDAQWLKLLIENVGPFDVAVGNNDWTNGVLAAAGYTTHMIPDLDRSIYQATFIRELHKNQQQWADRVPEYLQTFIQKEL